MCVRIVMAGWLHGVFVGEWLFVFPLCGFSLSLFCNYLRGNLHSSSAALFLVINAVHLHVAYMHAN